MKLYYENIVSKGREEFLTEKQLDTGPIAIDCDFRYKLEITEKQYTYQHIIDLIYLYLNSLKQIYQFVEDESFPIYIFEKPHVNSLEEKKMTKDRNKRERRGRERRQGKRRTRRMTQANGRGKGRVERTRRTRQITRELRPRRPFWQRRIFWLVSQLHFKLHLHKSSSSQ